MQSRRIYNPVTDLKGQELVVREPPTGKTSLESSPVSYVFIKVKQGEAEERGYCLDFTLILC